MNIANIDNENIEWIDTNAALKLLRRSAIIKRRYSPNRTTLIAWVTKYDLGYKFAGRFQINKDKFMYFIKRGNINGYTQKT